MYLTDDLNPVLDLNMADVNPQMTGIRSVAALPDGGGFVMRDVFSNRAGVNNARQVLRVNVTGQVIQYVLQCVWMCKRYMTYGTCRGCYLDGLLVLNNNLYVIYLYGKVVQIDINNINSVQVYQVPNVLRMTHSGSLSYHPSVITHPDLLFLADSYKGEIFSYNVTSNNKQVLLSGLSVPTSVSLMTYNSHLYYIVCERAHDQVRVYNSNWGLYQTLGGYGSDDGQLNNPFSALGLPYGSIIISDSHNNHISLFTIQGKFVRHLFTRSDGLYRPQAMSKSLPYLWVVGNGRLHRYKLY